MAKDTYQYQQTSLIPIIFLIKMELMGKMFLEKIFFIVAQQTVYIKELFEHKEIKIILDMRNSFPAIKT